MGFVGTQENGDFMRALKTKENSKNSGFHFGSKFHFLGWFHLAPRFWFLGSTSNLDPLSVLRMRREENQKWRER